jgi:ABC-type multidrug transport system ATPase subunit
MPVLEIDNLVKEFRNLKAVDNLSLSVEKGEIYGFLGPNGAGKSTSIRIILSLIKPTSGSIALFGKKLRWGDRDPFGKIGALVERPDFYNYLPAFRNLEFFGAISNADVSKENLFRQLKTVGLEGREKDKVKTYSLGMKQRLGIAQALLHDPEFIILDEPTNGLDPQGMHEMRELIKSLSRDHGKTVFLSSHILAEVESIASSMAIINKGKTLVQGKVQSLLDRGSNKILMRVSSLPESIEALQGSRLESDKFGLHEDYLQLLIPKGDISYVVDLLRMHNIDIYEIKSSRSLEAYFLDVTKGKYDQEIASGKLAIGGTE